MENIYGEGFYSREDFINKVIAESKPSKLTIRFLVSRIADLKEEIAKLREENQLWSNLFDKQQSKLNIQEKSNSQTSLDDILETWKW